MELDGAIEERVNPNAAREPNNHHGINKKQEQKKEKEGHFLLGLPTFLDLGSGRFRCVETGHELPAKEKDSYARSKACRLALIDAAVYQKKPPLNFFQPHPLSKSKLVCDLTGDTVNKSEEHIWKHISGKRFQNQLEQKEEEKLAPVEKTENDAKQSKKKSKLNKIVVNDVQKINADENGSMERKPVVQSSDSEEPDFWIPPAGDRWDFDDGKDRWDSSKTSDHETDADAALDGAEDKDDIESGELSVRTKRMSIAVGPSSFASRKKKIKKGSPTHQNDSCDIKRKFVK